MLITKCECQGQPIAIKLSQALLQCKMCIDSQSTLFQSESTLMFKIVQTSRVLARLICQSKLCRSEGFFVREIEQYQKYVLLRLKLVQNKFKDLQYFDNDLWQPPNKITNQLNRLFQKNQDSNKRYQSLYCKHQKLLKELSQSQRARQVQQMYIKDSIKTRSLVDKQLKLRLSTLQTRILNQKVPKIQNNLISSRTSFSKSSMVRKKEYAVLKIKYPLNSTEYKTTIQQFLSKNSKSKAVKIFIKDHRMSQPQAKSIFQCFQQSQLQVLHIQNHHKFCKGQLFQSLKQLRDCIALAKEGQLLACQWI